MPKLKKYELKNMNVAQLKEKENELRKELMKINSQIKMGVMPKNPGNVRTIKKTIAFIKMLIHQKKKSKEVSEEKK